MKSDNINEKWQHYDALFEKSQSNLSYCKEDFYHTVGLKYD